MSIMEKTTVKLLKLISRFGIYIIDGIVIGMAIMIPGVSGGSMIMSMGLYPTLLALIGGNKEERKGALPTLIPVVIGLLTGIVAFAYLLKLALSHFPLQTAAVFIGLILGGIPMLTKEVKGQKPTFANIAAFLIAVGVMIAMLVFSARANLDLSLKPSVWHFILTVILGFLSASTMIIPGVSGSALMLILGYYMEITGRVKLLADGIAHLDGAAVGENVLVFVPYLIGAAVGIVLTSKGLKRLLEKHPVTTYYALIGLMVTSPVAVIVKVGGEYGIEWGSVGVWTWVTAAVCLAAGFAVAWFLSAKEAKDAEKKEISTESEEATTPATTQDSSEPVSD